MADSRELLLKLKIKQQARESAQRLYRFELTKLEKREDRLFKYTLGWAALGNIIGGAGSIILTNPLALLATISLTGLLAAIGWRNHRITDQERRRAEARLKVIQSPIEKQLEIMERQLGVTIHVTP